VPLTIYFIVGFNFFDSIQQGIKHAGAGVGGGNGELRKQGERRKGEKEKGEKEKI